MKYKILFFLLICALAVNFVNAAAIYGTVYDLSLKKVGNARVEINTLPKQFLIAQNGSYSFDVPNGDYIIKAQLMQKNIIIASVQENITIRQPGNYVLDLILFPDVEEGIDEINTDVNENVVDSKSNPAVITIVVLIIALSIGAVYYIRKNRLKQKETKEDTKQEQGDDDLNQLIKIIKNEGGRATQKDIRKQIPLSEAKISLMIAELEHNGIVEKIKKGRGNIIILKRK